MPVSKKNPGIVFFGTRPELIKIVPILKEAKKASLSLETCSTGQQKDLLEQSLKFFNIEPDHSLESMIPGQGLCQLYSTMLSECDKIIRNQKPSFIIVHGDTATTFCASTAAFLNKIPVYHIEAGLRSGDVQQPFPEEFNRSVCTNASSLHFAPTPLARLNLLRSGVNAENIFVVGNTIVDALIQTIETTNIELPEIPASYCLMTLHRRETLASCDKENIAKTIKLIAQTLEKTNQKLLLISHPNPAQAPFYKELENDGSIKIIPPQDYGKTLGLILGASAILTDSGGIVEEATSLGKLTLCLRERIERQELLAGLPKFFLTGLDWTKIKSALDQGLVAEQSILLNQSKETILKLALNQAIKSPLGNGTTAEKIVQIIKQKHQKPDSENLWRQSQTKQSFGQEAIVAVHGLGYVGLPTAILLAGSGARVIGIDPSLDRLSQIQNKNVQHLEPDMQDLLEKVVSSGDLTVVENYSKANQTFNYHIICVPTPLEKNKADLTAVWAVTDSIIKNLAHGATIIVESTCAVGTSDAISEYIAKKTNMVAEQDFFVTCCPERVLPGNTRFELENNSRVIGAESQEGFFRAAKLYQYFCQGKVSRSTRILAEMTKLVENSSRAVSIAMANEFADLARIYNQSPWELIKLTNEHPRVKLLNPGIGVGGHCIAVDPVFLIAEHKQTLPLLATSMERLALRPKIAAQKIKDALLAKNFNPKPKILILGLAYKPNVPDTREAPALEIVKNLAAQNFDLTIFEPNLTQSQITSLGLKPFLPEDGFKSIEKFDIAAILVKHSAFDYWKESLAKLPQILDFVGLLEGISSNKEKIVKKSERDLATLVSS